MPFSLHTMSRRAKRNIFLVADTVLIPISLYAAFAFRYGTAFPTSALENSLVLFPLMVLLGIFVIVGLKLPNIKLNAMETRAIMKIGLASISLAIIAMVCSYLFLLSAPRSVPVLFGAIFFVLSVFLRIAGLYTLAFLTERSMRRVPVAIYGAGSAGIQLALALRQSSEVCPKFFVDDNPQLKGLLIAGLPVFAPGKLESCVSSYKIKHVLVAMPSVSQSRRDQLVKNLSHLPVEVRILPSYIDMIENDNLLTTFRTVSPDELLGRNKVDLDIPEIAKTYIGRVIMVTGAGGSIGSELCRQILECKPARIILFERSEFNLYSIDRELRELVNKHGIPVTPRLGSVTDKARVAAVIDEENVEIILHAAAYKHVPLVEENKLEGARNNVLGTQTVALCAAEAEIERFILISTDKAVRPTNVMGATKRMAELVVQDIQTRHQKTKFAMVRFGNVLGSSGSVLPLFQKQIQAGGPVTVTHPNVTRFFMTIPEASRLVLLAGAYAKGGDVFVLDMGEPLKIIDVARQMIELSGRTIKDPLTGVGDIAISVTGLRPGEKLYEELLLDDDSLRPTPHAKILRAEEAMLSQIEVAAMLRELGRALSENDPDRLFRLIQDRVEGFHRQNLEDDSLSV